MMKTNEVDKIRNLLKNINKDEEIDEIHEILDRLDGSAMLQNDRISGQVAEIVKNGLVTHVEIVHNDTYSYQVGGGYSSYPDGPIEAQITVQADPRDIYDD